MGKQDDRADLEVYPSIALSDGVNAACCWWAANEAMKRGRRDVGLGIGLVALASSIGTLRFGFSPKTFAGANAWWADLAGRVGVPLIGIGYIRARGQWPELFQSGEPGLPWPVLIGLGVCALASQSLSASMQELYTTLVATSGMLGLGFVEQDKGNPTAMGAVVLFVVAGIAVGSDRHRRLLGMRRENIFHYLLGTAMVMFAKGLPPIDA